MPMQASHPQELSGVTPPVAGQGLGEAWARLPSTCSRGWPCQDRALACVILHTPCAAYWHVRHSELQAAVHGSVLNVWRWIAPAVLQADRGPLCHLAAGLQLLGTAPVSPVGRLHITCSEGVLAISGQA
jgi:hypothetical protein